QGKAVGLVKIRMFRPAPLEQWRRILGSASRVVVLDRNLVAGQGGVFASEIQAALYPLGGRPLVYPVVAGLGGRDVTPEDVVGIAEYAMERDAPPDSPLFWGLKE
ncbi:MAG: pyruvate ferredoxin oxidoreductase, partial [Deltaproteobacteria bacterium]|nr:pyruvate ferredoxin oxidoreductase [Deltaproteobacteria bacterium]